MKKIGPYQCQKAVATFRGRDYTAWFTRDVPINAGPWKLHGLPGLIIMAIDNSGEVRFTVSSITRGPAVIKPDLDSAERISLDDYKEYQRSISRDIARKLSSKMPREMEITVPSVNSLENFD
jgi:GLPGLI family protein